LVGKNGIALSRHVLFFSKGEEMAPYYLHLVAFDIAWDGDAISYNTIYQPMLAAIKRGLPDEDWWSETSSMFIVKTTERSAHMHARVWKESEMRVDQDILIVINISPSVGTALGRINNRNIYSLIPELIKGT
jgi:hypothetical protein